MKHLFLLFSALLISSALVAQDLNNSYNSIVKTKDFFKKYHIKPIDYTEKEAGEIIDLYLDNLDPDGDLFTHEDKIEIKQHLSCLTKDNDGEYRNLIRTSIHLYNNRTKELDSLISKLYSSPIDAFKDSLYLQQSTEVLRSKNKKELFKHYRIMYQYNLVSDYITRNDSMFKLDKNFAIYKDSPERRKFYETKSKKAIYQLRNRNKNLEITFINCLNNAIALRHDPHSNFFSMAEKTDFESSLSTETASYGFSVGNSRENTIVVNNLTPGGAAWKSGKINLNDQLIKVIWNNGEEINFEGYELAEVYNSILSNKDNSATFVFKKEDGSSIQVTLFKSMVKVSENVINSYIIYTGNSKIGYLTLPAFYSEFNNKQAIGCANDVAKEIIKLKKDSICALILDIRNNGGGSMYEAISLAGIFIDEGALCIIKNRNEKPYSLKDMNRGTIYDGPLAVMVNGFSASASELLAGSLQDHRRAIVVGATTFGKATAQVVLPNDTNQLVADGYKNSDPENGFIKVTMEKIYRVTGKSHQYAGVVPDISFVSSFPRHLYSESSYKYSLQQDSIVKKTYYTPFPEIKIQELKTKSEQRTKKDPLFIRYKTLTDSLTTFSTTNRKLKLTPADLKKHFEVEQDFYKRFDALQLNTEQKLKVQWSPQNDFYIQNDEIQKRLYLESIKEIESDFLIKETCNILIDSINLTK